LLSIHIDNRTTFLVPLSNNDILSDVKVQQRYDAHCIKCNNNIQNISLTTNEKNNIEISPQQPHVSVIIFHF